MEASPGRQRAPARCLCGARVLLKVALALDYIKDFYFKKGVAVHKGACDTAVN